MKSIIYKMIWRRLVEDCVTILSILYNKWFNKNYTKDILDSDQVL